MHIQSGSNAIVISPRHLRSVAVDAENRSPAVEHQQVEPVGLGVGSIAVKEGDLGSGSIVVSDGMNRVTILNGNFVISDR